MTPLWLAGLVTLLGWMAIWLLLFTRTLWHVPAQLMDHWPDFYYTVQSLLPWQWLVADRATPQGLRNVALWLGLIALLCGLWLGAGRRVARLRTTDPRVAGEGLAIILTVAVLAGLLLAYSPGLTSSDVYAYVWYGRIAAIFHANPFIQPPAAFAGRDVGNWLQWVSWQDTPAVYGPAWLWPATALTALADAVHGTLATHVLLQRLFAVYLHGANTLLVWALAGQLVPRLWPRPADVAASAEDPSWQIGARLAATLFYAWCPLLLWEFGNNAHNDGLLVFWVLVALWCHLRGVTRQEYTGQPGGWWRGAVAALALAALVKVVALLLLPAYLLLVLGPGDWRHAWGRRLGIGAQAAGIMGALAALLYAPFWAGPATLQGLLDAPGNSNYSNSFGEVLRHRTPEVMHALAVALALPGAGGAAWSVDAVGASMESWLRPLLLGITTLLVLGFTLRVRDLRGLFISWGGIWLAYLLIGAVWFWPWYLAWLLPLVALLGPGRLRTATVLYTCGGLALTALTPRLAPPFDALEGLVPLICFGPVALYLLYGLVRDAWGRRAMLEHTKDKTSKNMKYFY
jgi:hypothetical protein